MKTFELRLIYKVSCLYLFSQHASHIPKAITKILGFKNWPDLFFLTNGHRKSVSTVTLRNLLSFWQKFSLFYKL